MTDTSFNVDFTKLHSIADLKATALSNVWGPTEDFWFSGADGLALYGQPSNGYAACGLEQPTTGKSAGSGYGTFSFTGKAGLAGQGAGICFVMWRADNVWLDSAEPGTLTELDILESWDGTKTVEATDHYWQSTAVNNGQIFHPITGIDPSVFHTYTMQWGPGLLVYSVDGVEYYRITGASVPKDFADGDCNYTMGAEVVYETGPVSMYIRDMSYTVPGGIAPPVTTPPVTTPPVTTPPVVSTAPMVITGPATVAPGANGTGSGTYTVTLPAGVTTAHAVVQGSPASGAKWRAAATLLTVTGSTALFNATGIQNGDHIAAWSDTAVSKNIGDSAAIAVVAVPVPPTQAQMIAAYAHATPAVKAQIIALLGL